MPLYMKISVFGTGYVGLVTGASLANLGHDVLCVDIDQAKVLSLQRGEVPFYEPGLKELLTRTTAKGKLRFTTNSQEGVLFGDVIFNCVGTPMQENGSANLQYIFAVVETVAQHAIGKTILINKSTVPPGTAAKCQQRISMVNPNSQVEVVSNPEFLKEGSAVHDFMHPDKIVIGAKSKEAFEMMRKVYAGLERPYMNILETNWETSEMIKYANNSFLATKISFINEIANIADCVGADIKTISRALGMDYRISPKFLHAGIGYGGSCFPKDVNALVHAGKEKGYDAKLLREVHEFNERQKRILLQKVEAKFGADLEGKKFAVWGLSFKPKTSDIREAPSLLVLKHLLAKGAEVAVYDPVAHTEIEGVFGDKVKYANTVLDSVQGSSAILLLTEWDEFRHVDFADFAERMAEKVLFDGRNIYLPETMRKHGFEYFGVGRS